MAKNFEPTGKVRILIRTEIRILPPAVEYYGVLWRLSLFIERFVVTTRCDLFGLVIRCVVYSLAVYIIRP